MKANEQNSSRNPFEFCFLRGGRLHKTGGGVAKLLGGSVMLGASGEIGYRFGIPVGEMDLRFVPQAQLLWSNVDFEDFCDRKHDELANLHAGSR